MIKKLRLLLIFKTMCFDIIKVTKQTNGYVI